MSGVGTLNTVVNEYDGEKLIVVRVADTGTAAPLVADRVAPNAWPQRNECFAVSAVRY